MSRGALRAMFRPYVEFDFTRMAFDTRVSFSRSSTGTYFDAAGVMQTAASNVPRKAHNPATGAVRGLMVEEQRTNLAHSFLTWNKRTGMTVANNGDGTFTIYNPGGHDGLFYAYPPEVVGLNYTLSFDLKMAAGTGTAVSIINGSTITQGPATAVNASAYTGFLHTARINTASHIGINCPVGTSIVRRLQFEQGVFKTSFIPTTTATVTRAADIASVTIPPRVVRLVTIYDDGTTSQQAVTPGASYTIPTGQKPILRIRGYFA